MFLTMLKNGNLALAFLLELGVLAALGFWGFSTASGTVAKVVLGIGLPLAAIVVWGLFGSPKAMWHLNGLWRVLQKASPYQLIGMALGIAAIVFLSLD